MKRRNATRNALFTSMLSLLLCVSMLVGTTFAWFTDSVVSGNNVIAAGNLDIELEYYDGSDWKTVNGATELFTGNLWEPGHTEVVYLKLSNLGTLALKYHLGINIASETEGTNVAGKTFKLSNHIYMGVVENAEPTYTTREAAITAAKGGANGIIGAGYTKSGSMVGKTGSDEVTQYLALVVYMPTTVGNEANYMTGTAVPTINLGINLFATQVENENDSFGNDYDKGAAWAGEVTEVPAEVNGVITITSAGELAAFAASVNSGNAYTGKTIKLGANIDLNDIVWTPIGTTSNPFNGNFYGEGYTVSNLFVQGGSWVGLFGYVKNAAHIEGVTIDGAVVSGNDYVGAVLGGGYLAQNCVKNCTVKNAEITATPYLKADGVTYDGGAKAGAVAGYAINGNISGNTAINCVVTAYRDLGGIVGMVSGENRAVNVTGNTVDTVTLTYLDLNGAAYDENKVNENMGNIVGRTSNVTNAGTLEADNTATNVTRKSVITWNDGGIVYTKDVDTGVVTLIGFTAEYTSESLTVPTGVTALGNKILNGNTTIKEVTIPAGLTDFGGTPNANGKGATGGFFYKSAVEKITLPEGLTEIPAAAFNQATNLKEVNIPSTVTTIGINAFAGTGLTELTVPSTITSIGYGAFRDMANLTTVTIEGDSVTIPGYAFRNCASLTTIYMKVNTLTLGDGMIFTNTGTNNEDPNNITIYVFNDAVCSTLNDNANVKCTIVKYTQASTTDALKNAILAGETNIWLADGNYTMPTDVSLQSKTLTIKGTKDTVIDVSNVDERNQFVTGANLTFEGVTLNFGTKNYMGFANTASLTYKDCTINGLQFFYGSGTTSFVNCDLNSNGAEHCAWTWGGQNISFTDCDFTYGDRAVNCYGENVTTDVTFTNCTFTKVAGKDTTGAIETNSSTLTTLNLTINECSVNEGDLWWVSTWDSKGGANTYTTIDGKVTVDTAKQLAAVVAKGATDITLMDGEYNVENCGGKTLTINGSKNAVIKLYNDGEDGCDYAFGSAGTGVGTYTFNGVTLDTTGNTGNYKGFAYMKGIFNDCNFVGAYSLNNANDFVFNRCIFDFKNGYFWTWGANSVTFDGCTFNGNSKTILAHGSASTVITINNCNFAATEKGYTGSGDNTAVVEIDPVGSNTYTINFTGENTKTDSYAGWTRVKDGSTGHTITGVN